MQNEAASVDDHIWKTQTRHALTRRAVNTVAVEVGVYSLLLIISGYVLTVLVDHALRFSVLNVESVAGRWVTEQIGFLMTIEVYRLVPPAVLAGVLCTLRFSRTVVIILGTLSVLPMVLGAWIYVSTHGQFSYPSTDGVTVVNQVQYVAWFNTPFLLVTFALVVLGASAGRAVDRRATGRRA